MTAPPAPSVEQPQTTAIEEVEPVNQAPILAGSPLGEADTVLGGVRLGMTLEEVRQLGQLEESSSGGLRGTYWIFHGSEGSLHLYERDGLIIEVETSSDTATPRGLRKGDPKEQVEHLYGKPHSVNKKWGEWVYEGPRPFTLLVGIIEERVYDVRIINFGLTEPQPEPGREVAVASPIPPLAPDDFLIGEFAACWTPEQAQQHGFEPFRYPKSDTPGYASTDGFVRFFDDPGGLNTFTWPRIFRTTITGGAYQTARDVRVGDPDSRIEALYGPAEHHGDGWDSILKYELDHLTLRFTANVNGRITAIEVSCYRGLD